MQNNIWRRVLSGALILNLAATGTQAQSFKEKFDAFTHEANENYEDFRDKANKTYAEFMRKAWRWMDIEPPAEKLNDDLFFEIEGRDAFVPDSTNSVMYYMAVDLAPKPKPQPLPLAPIKLVPMPNEKWVEIDFYGTPVNISFQDDQVFKFESLSHDELADTWLKCSGKKYNNTIRDCLALRQKLNLNDWAYMRLLLTLGDQVMPSRNEARFIAAFIYAQSGYKMRLYKKDGNEIGLIYASSENIYGQPRVRIQGNIYYTIDRFVGTVDLCDIPFDQEQPVTLTIHDSPQFNKDFSDQRTIKSMRYPEMSVSVKVDKNLIDFYNGYPQFTVGDDQLTRWSVYADMPLNEDVKKQLYPTLRAALADCDQITAINKLLNFVQTGFEYGYDSQIWGCDRAFFGEETLYYPKSDCEDRAILYTRLVRDLLNLPSALIYYPGHLGAAVALDEECDGDFVMVNGVKYMISDPTYRGASIGMSMRNCPVTKATAILLD